MEYIPPFLIGIIVFIFGLLIGSFLNVVIYRLPREESVVFPASHCPNCNTAIKPYDNIPVFSYLILGGRCRNCKTGISIKYPLVELLVGCLYLLVFVRISNLYPALDSRFWLHLIAEIVFVSLIVPLVFIDLEHQLLPNALTYPGLVIMTVLRLLAPDPVSNDWIAATFNLMTWPEWALSLTGSAMGAIIGGGSLWLVRELYYRVKRVEGMGLGDVKLMLMVGAFLGWQQTLLTIFMGSLLGSIIGITLIKLRGGGMKTAIPFGVFLGPAAIICMFIGHGLIGWYLGFYK